MNLPPAALAALLAAAVTATAAAAPLPAVQEVYPSGATVSERLLRLSLRFAAPPDGAVLPLLALVGDDGAARAGALLAQELWSPDRRTLTVLLEPGRVKTGLIAHDTLGPPLVAGRAVSLTLAGRVLHRWRVVAGGCTVPDPSQWRLAIPAAGSKLKLAIALPGAIDAQALPLIAVVDAQDRRVAGTAALLDGETRWRLQPDRPWQTGAYRVLVHPRLESPCGDEVAEGFEHAAGSGLGSARQPAVLAFRIVPPPAAMR